MQRTKILISPESLGKFQEQCELVDVIRRTPDALVSLASTAATLVPGAWTIPATILAAGWQFTRQLGWEPFPRHPLCEHITNLARQYDNSDSSVTIDLLQDKTSSELKSPQQCLEQCGITENRVQQEIITKLHDIINGNENFQKQQLDAGHNLQKHLNTVVNWHRQIGQQTGRQQKNNFIEDLKSASNFIGQLGSLVKCKELQQVATMAQSGIIIYENVTKLITAVNIISKGGDIAKGIMEGSILGPVGAIGGAIAGIVSLFDNGTSSSEIILQQIAELSKQLVSLEKKIDRYFEVNFKQQQMLLNIMVHGFANISNQLSNQIGSFRVEITHDLKEINAHIQFMQKLIQVTQVSLVIKDFEKLIIDVRNIDQGTKDDAIKKFKQELRSWLCNYTTSTSENGSWLNGVQVWQNNPPLETRIRFLEETTCNSQLWYLAMQANAVREDDKYEIRIIPNPLYWYQAASCYAKLGRDFPWIDDPNEAKTNQEIKDVGKQGLQFLDQISEDSLFWDKLFEKYQQSFKSIKEQLERYIAYCNVKLKTALNRINEQSQNPQSQLNLNVDLLQESPKSEFIRQLIEQQERMELNSYWLLKRKNIVESILKYDDTTFKVPGENVVAQTGQPLLTDLRTLFNELDYNALLIRQYLKLICKNSDSISLITSQKIKEKFQEFITGADISTPVIPGCLLRHDRFTYGSIKKISILKTEQLTNHPMQLLNAGLFQISQMELYKFLFKCKFPGFSRNIKFKQYQQLCLNISNRLFQGEVLRWLEALYKQTYEETKTNIVKYNERFEVDMKQEEYSTYYNGVSNWIDNFVRQDIMTGCFSLKDIASFTDSNLVQYIRDKLIINTSHKDGHEIWQSNVSLLLQIASKFGKCTKAYEDQGFKSFHLNAWADGIATYLYLILNPQTQMAANEFSKKIDYINKLQKDLIKFKNILYEISGSEPLFQFLFNGYIKGLPEENFKGLAELEELIITKSREGLTEQEIFNWVTSESIRGNLHVMLDKLDAFAATIKTFILMIYDNKLESNKRLVEFAEILYFKDDLIDYLRPSTKQTSSLLERLQQYKQAIETLKNLVLKRTQWNKAVLDYHHKLEERYKKLRYSNDYFKIDKDDSILSHIPCIAQQFTQSIDIMLSSLEFNGLPITNEHVKGWTEFLHYYPVKRVRLTNCQVEPTILIIMLLNGIEEIEFDNVNFEHFTLDDISCLIQSLPNLQTIKLTSCNLKAEQLQKLFDELKNGKCRVISDGSEIIDGRKKEDVIRRIQPNVSNLYIDFNIGPASLTVLYHGLKQAKEYILYRENKYTIGTGQPEPDYITVIPNNFDWMYQNAKKVSKKEFPDEVATRQYGFNCVNVPEDGNCLFHAVIHQVQARRNEINCTHEILAGLTGHDVASEELHMILRRKIVRYVDLNREQYEPQLNIDANGNIDMYLANMNQWGTWGDGTVIAAIKNVLQINVILLTPNGGVTRYVHANPIGTVFLEYNGSHYKSLVDNIENLRDTNIAANRRRLLKGEAETTQPHSNMHNSPRQRYSI